MGTIAEDVRARVEEARRKLKTRIEEWRERGPRAHSSPQERFPRAKEIVKEIREKGLGPTIRARREARIKRRRRESEITRAPREVEPAFPKARAVPEAAEIAPTVTGKEIAIEI